MLANAAEDGQRYLIKRRMAGNEWQEGICNGWNHSHEWLLFLTYTENGQRKIVCISPTEEIKPI